MIDHTLLTNGFVFLVLIFVIVLKSKKNRSNISQEVNRLISSSRDISKKIFYQSFTVDLPTPVRRYFFYALKEGQPFISYARLRHNGSFKPHPKFNWMQIWGEEFFTTENPGFHWYGRTAVFQVIDKFIDGKGILKVYLFSFLKLMNYEGKGIDQGELFRWLAEAVWFPTALLPSENIRWEAIDEDSAKVILSNKGVSIEGIFHFNELGQVTRFEARRPSGKEVTLREKWTCHYADYREVNGIYIPFYGETVWNLAEGDYCYARFNLLSITYQIRQILTEYAIPDSNISEKAL